MTTEADNFILDGLLESVHDQYGYNHNTQTQTNTGNRYFMNGRGQGAFPGTINPFTDEEREIQFHSAAMINGIILRWKFLETK